MKRYPACIALLATTLAVVPSALAHPGHAGHELTWDYAHLAAHPLATLGCFTLIGAILWLGWRALRPASDQSRKTTPARRQDH